MTDRVDDILACVKAEFGEGSRAFPAFNTPHEGYAVILEEVDELWAEVKKHVQIEPSMRIEAIQVAAMAVRFVHDLCLGEVYPPTSYDWQTPKGKHERW